MALITTCQETLLRSEAIKEQMFSTAAGMCTCAVYKGSLAWPGLYSLLWAELPINLSSAALCCALRLWPPGRLVVSLQVPRFWLVGYDEDRQPLPASKVRCMAGSARAILPCSQAPGSVSDTNLLGMS